jgi:hypothetical protein
MNPQRDGIVIDMFGSKTVYAIQGRVQDYWLDCWKETFRYVDEAQKLCKTIQELNPTKDYRVVKRFTTYEDTVVEETKASPSP